jgi:hypothetical protein
VRLKLRGGVWYYRAKVPAEVRQVLRKGELVYSLRTSDGELAKARALELSAGQLRLCRALRQAGQMTSEEVDRLVARYMISFKENREEDSINFGPKSPEAAREHLAWVRQESAAAEDDLLHNRLSAVERLAVDLLREEGTRYADAGDEVYRRLCFRLLRARVDVMRDEVKALPSTTPSATAGAPEAASESPRVSEMVAAYLIHRDASDPMSKNTRVEAVAAYKMLVSLLGDPPLASVKNKDAQDLVAKMSRLPSRWRSRYMGKTAAEVRK